MSDTIIVTHHKLPDETGWMEILLNRPDRLNAFNEEMHNAMQKALTEAAAPDIRAVLITGAGRGFCAGQDLEGRDPRGADAPYDLGQTLAHFYNPMVTLIRGLEKPVICAVNGVAAGAGANIAFACDIVIASAAAKFIQSFAKVGLIPDAGGTHSLTHLIGPLRAKALAMTAKPLSAQKAHDWGLVWAVHEEDVFHNEARRLAEDLAQGATLGLAETKKAIHHALSHNFDEQLAYEAEAQRKCGFSEDYVEGVTAFLEKRPAKFKGQ